MKNKLTDQDRLAIAKRLKASSDDSAVGVAEVAVLYNTTVARIYQCTSPAKVAAGKVTLCLPRALPNVNGRRKVWRLGDLLEKIRSHVGVDIGGGAQTTAAIQGPGLGDSSPAKPVTRMGRPRAN